jgi:hypothetical protein
VREHSSVEVSIETGHTALCFLCEGTDGHFRFQNMKSEPMVEGFVVHIITRE